MTDLQIFKNAPHNPSAEELGSYLDEACGGDATLRARVEALFQADAKAGGFMERPAADARPTVEIESPAVLEGPGTQIGRYKLLQEIGSGGFGVVYMAEQREPVKRRVALKIIKIGMDTQQVVARFEAERQALAMMDHPNIAKVLDAGATETGRPYFVMELVKGVRITEYCDDNQLTTRERLELYIPVCQAIQHAHQKGIIHRDIKPSNVMVTLHDGVPVPKVIDFGIAKATQAELTEKTIFTQYGQMLALFGNADAGRPEPRIEIWDLSREQLLRSLPPTVNPDANLTFSGDGRYLLIQSVQGTRIYETTTFSVVDEFSGFGGSSDLSSFLPGTPLVAVPRPQQRRVLIRDHQKHETVAVFEEAVQSYVAVFATGGEFLVTFNTSGLNLYPLARADECLTLAAHRVSVPGIAFSPDGTRLASVSKDLTVGMWDAGSGQRIWAGDRPLPGPGQAVAISPDGRLLATGDLETPLIQLWDTESGHQLLQLTNAAQPGTWSLLFVPDPRQGLLLVRSGSEGVSVWHIESTRAVLDRQDGAVRWIGSRSPGKNMGEGLVAAPDGKRIVFHSFSMAPQFNLTAIQDPLGEQPPLTLAPPASAKSVQSLSFTPDGKSVAVLTSGNRVAVFDTATGEPRRDFAVTGSNPSGRQLVLSPAGRWLAVTSPSMRGVDIYDFATGKLRYTLPDREGTVYWLAWHPKEPRLAIASDNGDIALWDLAKIDRQLEELGLGFALAPAESQPTQDKP